MRRRNSVRDVPATGAPAASTPRTFVPATIAPAASTAARRALATFALVAFALAGPARAADLPAPAEPWRLSLDPVATTIAFTLPATAHTVNGVLVLRSGEIAFDPATGETSGEIVVDLAAAKTGNDRRDRNMHADVLETDKFPVAVFRPRRLTGHFAEEGTSELNLEGTLTFHGANHSVALAAKVVARDGRVTADVVFPVPFVRWGLKDPSVFVLRVAKVVDVRIEARGTLHPPAPPED